MLNVKYFSEKYKEKSHKYAVGFLYKLYNYSVKLKGLAKYSKYKFNKQL